MRSHDKVCSCSKRCKHRIQTIKVKQRQKQKQTTGIFLKKMVGNPLKKDQDESRMKTKLEIKGEGTKVVVVDSHDDPVT